MRVAAEGGDVLVDANGRLVPAVGALSLPRTGADAVEYLIRRLMGDGLCSQALVVGEPVFDVAELRGQHRVGT